MPNNSVEMNVGSVHTTVDLVQITPASVSMWPDTLAWKVLMISVLLTISWLLWKRYNKHQKLRWKRQALQEAEIAFEKSKADVWFKLIKRVFLVHHSREEVSEINDSELIAHLTRLETHSQKTLVDAHYKPDSRLSLQTNTLMYQAFTQWLKSLPDDAQCFVQSQSMESRTHG